MLRWSRSTAPPILLVVGPSGRIWRALSIPAGRGHGRLKAPKSKESELGNDPRTYYVGLEAVGLAWGRARRPFVYYNGWIVAGLIQA